ncbi:MAG: GNAT family N-acetyltransferase [Bacteroidia bacterium]|nr:GNAT family N-acetyltransferase [Bacteroidia bacterium]
MAIIRIAKLTDMHRVNEIYNQAVLQKFQTADSTIISLEDRIKWFQKHHDDRYLVLVLEEDHVVKGWATLSKYRNGRAALRNTAEVSYYVHEDHQGQGVGTQLLNAAIEKAKEIGFKNLFAMLLEANTPSIGILEKFGFREWGRIPLAAEIDNQEYDHLYYGLRLNS